jgi:polyphosphate glucokinase
MLFLGLGTGLGTTLIESNRLKPMELGHLPYKKSTYEEYVGRAGLERHGEEMWRRHVADVIERLMAALRPNDTVIGGGNVKKLKALPPRCRGGENANAFLGGFRLWDFLVEEIPVRAQAPTNKVDAPNDVLNRDSSLR